MKCFWRSRLSKRNIIVVITLALLVFGGMFTNQYCASAAELSPKVQQLVQYIQKNNHASAEDILRTLTVKEKDEFIEYIKSNNATIPPLYYIKMADYVFKTDKDEAALWYYIGKVRAYEDVKMCKDKTSQAQLSIYPKFAPKTVKYVFSRSQDKAYLADLMQQTLDWDIQHPQRVSPVWACYQGISAQAKPPELVSEQQRAKVIEQVRGELIETINKYGAK